MPSGANTASPWSILNSNTQAAAAFGAGLDSNNQISGQNGGNLFVYQQNPASLSLDVDTGFLQHVAGTGFVFQGGGSPVAVTLTIPLVNPQYATIYWDNQANSVGVQYSAQAASPTPLFPESWSQIPLAVVYLVPGMTVIQANSIFDVRSLLLPIGYKAAGLDPFNAAGGTVNCHGVSDLMLRINIGTSGPGTLTLQNLSWFTRITLLVENTTAANRSIFFAPTTPAGNTFTTTLQGNRNNGTVAVWSAATSVQFGLGSVYCMKSYWSKNQAVLLMA